jgi:hypothetical protein
VRAWKLPRIPHSALKEYRWIHANHSYKSGGALESHFGLGKATAADVTVTLPSRKTLTFAAVEADQFLELSLKAPDTSPASRTATPTKNVPLPGG